jgi:hypothetical protein
MIAIKHPNFDQVRHGSAFDRGAADSYYSRGPDPHYYVGATYMSERISCEPSTPEYQDYMAGYDYNEQFGDRKDWG